MNIENGVEHPIQAALEFPSPCKITFVVSFWHILIIFLPILSTAVQLHSTDPIKYRKLSLTLVVLFG